MAFTLATDVEDAIYRVNLTFQDIYGEETKKVSRLANVYDADNEGIEKAYQILELLTEAKFSTASASIDADVTGAKAIATNAGFHHFAAHAIVLGFERAHPLNAAKTVTTVFTIPAPDGATTIDGNLQLVMTRGVSMTLADTDVERLGALVDWLEDSLTFEDITGDITVGGWTYAAGRSGVITQPRILEGVANT